MLVIASLSFVLDLAALLGQALGALWVFYGLVLVVTTMYPGHGLVFVYFLYLAVHEPQPGPIQRAIALPFELFYCLLNPLVYLLIFVRTSTDGDLFLDVRSGPLDPLAWTLLVVLWALRFVPKEVLAARRNWVRSLLIAGLVVLAVYTVRDFSQPVGGSGTSFSNSTVRLYYLGGIAMLYLIPGLTLVRFLRDTWRQPWRGFVLVRGSIGAKLGVAVAVPILLSVLLLHLRPSEGHVRDTLLSQRGSILEAAEATGTDPRTLAAMLHVLQRRQGGSFATTLETLLIETWRDVPPNTYLLADAVDPSIGFAQIKPTTAMTALYLVESIQVRRQGRYYFDAYTTIGFDRNQWSFDAPDVADLDAPDAWYPSRREVVDQLLDDRSAIWMCALILELHARQWDRAGHPIRDRPDILATLYQLGFDRSWPKAEPVANGFGRDVEQARQLEWIESFEAEGSD
ncbi:MAG: hypothetical protein AAGD38_21815 [Acidobacteriota bacterium]